MPFPAALAKTLVLFDIAAPYAAVGGVLLALIALGYAFSIHRRLRRLTVRRGDTLEDTLSELSRRVKELGAFREELEVYLKHSEARLKKTLRGVGIVRFNPFQGDGSGGNQSFAAAFLDEGSNGVVFSSIYVRGYASTYAKPVHNGASPFELTAEEREAITKAKEELTAATARIAPKK